MRVLTAWRSCAPHCYVTNVYLLPACHPLPVPTAPLPTTAQASPAGPGTSPPSLRSPTRPPTVFSTRPATLALSLGISSVRLLNAPWKTQHLEFNVPSRLSSEPRFWPDRPRHSSQCCGPRPSLYRAGPVWPELGSPASSLAALPACCWKGKARLMSTPSSVSLLCLNKHLHQSPVRAAPPASLMVQTIPTSS